MQLDAEIDKRALVYDESHIKITRLGFKFTINKLPILENNRIAPLREGHFSLLNSLHEASLTRKGTPLSGPISSHNNCNNVEQ